MNNFARIVAVPQPVFLFCLPHAGGLATFFDNWQRHFSDSINLIAFDYPGHGQRRSEASCHTLTELAWDVAKSLSDRIENGASYALFGHSMGAMVALEAVHSFTTLGLQPPNALFASSMNAPDTANTHFSATLNDDMLCLELIKLGAFPHEFIAQPRFFKPHLAALRSDLEILENYRYREDRLLPECDFIVMSGQDDPVVSQRGLQAWKRHTAGDCLFETFDGGHFYPSFCLPILASKIEEHLKGASRPIMQNEVPPNKF